MIFLVTFCNVSYLPKNYILGVYDWSEQKIQYVALASSERESILGTGVGATGIAKLENGYVVVTQSSTSPLIIYLDSCLNLLCYKTLELAKDPHSIAYNQGHIYITSTGNNSIVKLPFDSEFGSEEIFWSFNNESKDIIHLNGITFLNNEPIICCFGEKKDKIIRSGFIKNISNDKILLNGIREPHNLICHNNKLYVVESPTGSIYKIDGDTVEIVKEFTGYVRGLAIGDEGEIFVAKNARRKSSRHIGSKKNVPLVDANSNVCEWERAWICQSKLTQTTYIKQDITAYAFEVYDLILLNSDFTSANLIDFKEGLNQRILSYESLCADLKLQLKQSEQELSQVKKELRTTNAINTKSDRSQLDEDKK